MCILFVRHCSPSDAASGGYQLIVAANRDELLGRPARAADFWPEPYSHVLAGVDERADRPSMGTWIGASKLGRVAGITNFHTPASSLPPGAINVGSRGRGTLVGDFLRQQPDTTAEDIDTYARSIQAERSEYGAFTVLLWQLQHGQAPRCVAVTNVEDQNPPFVDGIAEVPCGVHVLTNGPLDAPWFKATRGRAEFERIIAEHASDRDAMVAAFLAMLQDRTLAPPPEETDRTPPQKLLYHELSSINVYHPDISGMGEYGTRAHTIILVDNNWQVYFEEHQRMADGSWTVRKETFTMHPAESR